MKMQELNMKLRLLNENLDRKVGDKNLAIKQHIASLKLDQETSMVLMKGKDNSDPLKKQV